MQNQMTAAEIAEVREIFRRFDINRDGLIQKEEFVELLRALDADLSEKGVLTALTSFDKNGDGVIEFQEFLDWFAEQYADGQESQRPSL